MKGGLDAKQRSALNAQRPTARYGLFSLQNPNSLYTKPQQQGEGEKFRDIRLMHGTPK